MGASTEIVQEHHGKGPKAGPVQSVIECVQSVQLNTKRIGC
jgi:hypothetical protein